MRLRDKFREALRGWRGETALERSRQRLKHQVKDVRHAEEIASLQGTIAELEARLSKRNDRQYYRQCLTENLQTVLSREPGDDLYPHAAPGTAVDRWLGEERPALEATLDSELMDEDNEEIKVLLQSVRRAEATAAGETGKEA